MIDSVLVFGDFKACPAPCLSILIPSYRCQNSLYRAIDSALNQPEDIKYEVLVVLNKPDEDIHELIERYAKYKNLYIYRNNENIGMVNNSNRCVDLARGHYIAFLHDDDYLHSNYIRIVADFINNFSEKCLITGRNIEYEGKVLRSERIKDIFRKIYFWPNLYRKKYKRINIIDSLKFGGNIYFPPSCGTIIERNAFLSVGGFDNTVAYSFDWDFFLRFNLKYRIIETTDICATYTVGDNASLRPDVIREFFDYTCKKFVPFVKKNHIDDRYIERYEADILFNAYMHARGVVNIDTEPIKKISKLRWTVYRIKTLLYFYNHNLDVQRLNEKTEG